MPKRKTSFGSVGGFNYAVSIDSLDSNEFYKKIFGQQLSDLRRVQDFCKEAKSDHVGSKGKATMASVKRWVKEVKPSEFYARWQKDSANYKDDCVEIFYKK